MCLDVILFSVSRLDFCFLMLRYTWIFPFLECKSVACERFVLSFFISFFHFFLELRAGGRMGDCRCNAIHFLIC